MSDPRGRILERVDQLEHLARSAKHMDGDHWERCASATGSVVRRIGVDVDDADYEMYDISQPLARATTGHIATWDPAAVLTLCAGLRQMVGKHQRAGAQDPTCGYCEEHGFYSWPCLDLEEIAEMLGIDPTGA